MVFFRMSIEWFSCAKRFLGKGRYNSSRAMTGVVRQHSVMPPQITQNEYILLNSMTYVDKVKKSTILEKIFCLLFKVNLVYPNVCYFFKY